MQIKISKLEIKQEQQYGKEKIPIVDKAHPNSNKYHKKNLFRMLQIFARSRKILTTL